MPPPYRLYLSHTWGFQDQYKLLLELLEKRAAFEYIDCFVLRDRLLEFAPDSITVPVMLRSLMQTCDVVLILAVRDPKYRPWIKIETAVACSGLSRSLPIVAVVPLGAQPPQILTQKADRVVAWRTESIVSAIHEVCEP